jgi:hypothetical protein
MFLQDCSYLPDCQWAFLAQYLNYDVVELIGVQPSFHGAGSCRMPSEINDRVLVKVDERRFCLTMGVGISDPHSLLSGLRGDDAFSPVLFDQSAPIV